MGEKGELTMQGQCGRETPQARNEKAQLPRSPLCHASLCGLSFLPQSFVCMRELSLQALCRRFQGAILAGTKVGPAGRVLGAAAPLCQPAAVCRPGPCTRMVGRQCGNLLRKLFAFSFLGFLFCCYCFLLVRHSKVQVYFKKK